MSQNNENAHLRILFKGLGANSFSAILSLTCSPKTSSWPGFTDSFISCRDLLISNALIVSELVDAQWILEKASGMHWYAPAVMLVAIFAGFFCALGHHLFYSSLAGTTAPTGQFEIVGASFSTQQLNTAIGTAFGFLVKSLLTITIWVAFVQTFWRGVRTSLTGPTLDSLDNAFSAMSNILRLFKFRVWKGFLIPLLLAAIAWYTARKLHRRGHADLCPG